MKVVVVGSFNVDITIYVDHLPAHGETVGGHNTVTGAGGKGSNQTIAAARLGADVSFVGCVGQDPFAQTGLDVWSENGVNLDHLVRHDQAATGIAAITVDKAGENTIAVALGANLALTPVHLDAAESAFAGADAMLVQLEIDPKTVHHALALAQKHGVRTILNPAPAIVLPSETVALADILTPNEVELGILSGVADQSLATQARRLMSRPDQTVVVTIGARGAHWVTPDADGVVPTFPVDVIDTVGAGDAFNAGLAVGLADGHPLSEAIWFANAVAALSVTRKGAAAAMPTRAEVDALLAG